MSLAREALARLDAATRLLPRAASLPEAPATRRLREQFSGPQKPIVPDHPEALRRRVIQAIRDARLDALPMRDRRASAWLLWTGTPLGTELPGLADMVRALAGENPRALRILIDAWLQHFDGAKRLVPQCGQFIARRLADRNDPRLQIWRAAHAAHQLFDAARGPALLARHLMQAEAPGAALAAAGFGEPMRASGGYMRAVHACVLAEIPALLRSSDAEASLRRVLAFAAPGGAPRFPDLLGRLADALLAPWLGGQAPAEPVRQAVQGFLLGVMGDPRVYPGRWLAVQDEATRIVRGWLARASLDTFFDVIRAEARADPVARRQWRYREAFWRACLTNPNGISEAWVVLGANVRRRAGTSADLDGAYGKLEGGNSSVHAVLLMRIGQLTLAEFNQNGRLRAWPADWKNAPRLYRQRYERDELFGGCLPFPPGPDGRGGEASSEGLRHIGSDTNYWQSSAAALLHRRTQLRLTPDDWQPR